MTPEEKAEHQGRGRTTKFPPGADQAITAKAHPDKPLKELLVPTRRARMKVAPIRTRATVVAVAARVRMA